MLEMRTGPEVSVKCQNEANFEEIFASRNGASGSKKKRKAETRIPVGRSRYLKVAITKVEWTFEFMVQVRRLKLDETGECDQLLGLKT